MNQTTVPWYRQPARLLRRLYDWVISWADTPYGGPALFLIAFVESSFFPIPPDVLLIALALGRPSGALRYALICSAGSVLGGIAGYGIGFAFWELAQGWFIPLVFSQQTFDAVRAQYAEHSFWIVFAAAFTPIPYKVFTIAAGVCSIDFLGFTFASVVGRSLRFFLVAGALSYFGTPARRFIDKYFDALALAFTALLVVGFVAVKKVL